MPSTRIRSLLTALAAGALPLAARAHDGHGAVGVERGWLHWVLEPQHGLVGLGVVLLLVATGRRMRTVTARQERPKTGRR